MNASDDLMNKFLEAKLKASFDGYKSKINDQIDLETKKLAASIVAAYFTNRLTRTSTGYVTEPALAEKIIDQYLSAFLDEESILARVEHLYAAEFSDILNEAIRKKMKRKAESMAGKIVFDKD